MVAAFFGPASTRAMAMTATQVTADFRVTALLDMIRARASARAEADGTSPWQGSVSASVRASLGSGHSAPVGTSPDLTRITNLPRRDPPDLTGVEGAALVELAIRRWGRGPRACLCQVPKERGGLGRDYCIDRPFPVQAWAMHEASTVAGLAGPITVGGGKTFLDIMLAMAVPGARQVVLLVPPKLREQLRREYLAVAEHWKVPSLVDGTWQRIHEGRPTVHVVPYSIFSRPESTALLEKKYLPDVVIADEAHALRSRDAARTARILRYWMAHPETKMCWLTGTAISKSLEDALHLFALALGKGSPLPLDPAVGASWAEAVDPGSCPAPPGALERFGTPVREGLRRRIIETPGVVASAGASIDTPLRVLEWKPPAVPSQVAADLDTLRNRMVRPDTQQLVDDMEVARCALELSCGFFYRWRFPRGESAELIKEWFDARKEWGAELRDKLGARRESMDSPHLCTEAARRAWGDIARVEGLPNWKADCWPRWRDVKDLVVPVTGDPVWVDEWFARAVADWASSRRAVVWYQFGAFGRRVAELLGVPMQTGGPQADARIRAERGDRSIVASLKAHGTGRDGLQFLFSECLLANPPSSGQTIEQVLGRLHRPGQKAAEVVAWLPRHTPEVRKAVQNATERSDFIDQMLHPGQKLASANFLPSDPCALDEADLG